MRFVIIGNGVAGINAAEVIRREQSEAEITIISSESDNFFSRPALMYLFCGQLSERDVEPFERDLYTRQKYTRIRGLVESLDVDRKTLVMDTRDEVPYDKLLIACGSKPYIVPYPGVDLDGVCSFVTLENLELMRQKANSARKAVVIGGGLIGIEAIEVLSLAGIECTFLVREDYFWPVAFSRVEGEMITAHMRHHGVTVILGTLAESIAGENGKVVGVNTDRGNTLLAEMVVLSTGVTANTEFLKDSGLQLDERGGIIVNDYLQTNLPDVYSAGDCASVVWFNDVRRPEQLWYTGRDQSRIAASNMCANRGDEREYKRGTFYNSAKFFDIEYTTAGLVNFNVEGERDWYQRDAEREVSQRVTYMPDGAVIGFNMLGSRWDHRPLVQWIEEKRHIDWVLEHLSEATFDEEFSRKFKVVEPAPSL